MDSKTYTKDLRKACVKAVFDEFAEHGDMIRPQYAEQWDEIEDIAYNLSNKIGATR